MHAPLQARLRDELFEDHRADAAVDQDHGYQHSLDDPCAAFPQVEAEIGRHAREIETHRDVKAKRRRCCRRPEPSSSAARRTKRRQFRFDRPLQPSSSAPVCSGQYMMIIILVKMMTIIFNVKRAIQD